MRRATLIGALAVALAARAEAQPRWRLVEELRIGGADSGAASLNDVRDIALGARGQIYVFDYQAQEIRLFDAGGKFVRLVGRKGAGPGEFTQPNGIRTAPDGSLWVNDHSNARFTVFTADGAFLKQVRVPPWGWGYRWDGVIDAQGRVLETVPRHAAGNAPGTTVVRRFDPASAKFDTLEIPPCLPGVDEGSQWTFSWRTARGGGGMQVPLAPIRVSRIDPSGAWWCGLGSDYHIKLMTLGAGETLAEIHGKAPVVQVPSRVRDSVIADLEKRTSAYPSGTVDASRVPRRYPRISEINVDDKGRLWVRRRGPTGLALDVWSRNGVRLATLDAPVMFGKYLPFLVRDEKLYAVVPDEDGVPFVVRYGIVR